MSYLHIHKTNIYDSLWEVGKSICFASNDFWNTSMLVNPRLFNNYPELVSEYQILLRELSLEYVRLINFSVLPSRKKCLFLIRNDKDQLKYWMNNIYGNKRVFEVEIDSIAGKLFKSRDILLPKKENSFKSMLEESKKYWEYNLKENFSDDEYIYEGKLFIKREILTMEGLN